MKSTTNTIRQVISAASADLGKRIREWYAAMEDVEVQIKKSGLSVERHPTGAVSVHFTGPDSDSKSGDFQSALPPIVKKNSSRTTARGLAKVLLSPPTY
jgi:hypothetical protein